MQRLLEIIRDLGRDLEMLTIPTGKDTCAFFGFRTWIANSTHTHTWTVLSTIDLTQIPRAFRMNLLWQMHSSQQMLHTYILFSELNSWKSRLQLHTYIFLEWIPKNDITRIRLWFRELHGKIVLDICSCKFSFQLHRIIFSELISL